MNQKGSFQMTTTTKKSFSNPLPNLDTLLHHFDYDHNTGEITWRNPSSKKMTKGDIAGTSNNQGYVCISFYGDKLKAHRIAWKMFYGSIDNDLLIDHINGNKSDNRISNLRLVSHLENNRNKRICNNNSSGYPGVIYYKNANKWAASINNNGKREYLGFFKKFEDAKNARIKKEKEYGYFTIIERNKNGRQCTSS
jgi:hypothetical protein